MKREPVGLVDHRASSTNAFARSNVRFAEPPRFSGSGSTVEASEWLRVMSSYLQRVATIATGWSVRLELDIAIGYLDGHAHALAQRVCAELAGEASWILVREALEGRFGVKLSAYAAMQALRGVKQGSNSVAQYTTEFENQLDYVLLAGFTDTLSIITFYVDGLADNIRLSVMDALTMLEHDPWAQFMEAKPGKAVRSIGQLAMRREEFSRLAPLAPKLIAQSARAAVISDYESSKRETRDVRVSRREELVRFLCKKYGIATAVMKQRLEANLCAACGQAGHVARACRGVSAKVAHVGSSAELSASSTPSNSTAH